VFDANTGSGGTGVSPALPGGDARLSTDKPNRGAMYNRGLNLPPPKGNNRGWT